MVAAEGGLIASDATIFQSDFGLCVAMTVPATTMKSKNMLINIKKIFLLEWCEGVFKIFCRRIPGPFQEQ
jgi:hypothetical protein